ncbi:MAG TPA: nucleoside-diphosphate kinase [bacterium]
MERTLSIIKPDGVQKNITGEIIKRFEGNDLRIAGMKMLHLTRKECMEFYHIHRDKPFYPSLVEFMSYGPVVVMVLEGENSIEKNRSLMGATDPAEAAKGTIRSDFGTNIERNAVHGSDSYKTAEWEIKFFFKDFEIFSRYRNY